MTKEEIIELAREAGDDWEHTLPSDREFLFRFASLVAKKERERCARVCEYIYDGEYACGDWPTPEMCAEAIRALPTGNLKLEDL